MQIRMSSLTRKAHEAGEGLSETDHHLWRRRFALGFPAFAALMTLFWLEFMQPDLGW